VRISGPDTVRAAGRELAARARAFSPDVVLCVLEGGAAVGREVGLALGVPTLGLDLSYGWSRLLSRAPAPLRLALWPLKEIAYRISGPRLGAGAVDALPRGGRAVLVDDTASSGRTLRAAFEALEPRGLPRAALFVAVIRCGARAKPLVDAYVTDDRLW
jgi:hypoxanthine phosphoribosyltransferase